MGSGSDKNIEVYDLTAITKRFQKRNKSGKRNKSLGGYTNNSDRIIIEQDETIVSFNSVEDSKLTYIRVNLKDKFTAIGK